MPSPGDSHALVHGAISGNPLLARESHRLSLVGAVHREVARWLVERELGTLTADQDGLATAVERICQKFFQHLARVTSLAACQSLLSRAVHIPRLEFAFLQGVRIGSEANPLIDGLHASLAGVDPAHARAGLEAALGTFFDLLAAFIGEELTLRMLRDVWPELPAAPC
jgi:hypothetical protein